MSDRRLFGFQEKSDPTTIGSRHFVVEASLEVSGRSVLQDALMRSGWR
jgi:hypothetical protein